MRVALKVTDILIITGGLGPTEDDLTRQAVAAYFGVELVEDAEALARIQERFAHRRLPMPESNCVQALVPASSTVIQNDRGTTAGFYVEAGENTISYYGSWKRASSCSSSSAASTNLSSGFSLPVK